ncbi:MAG: hypothetical protein AB1487_05910 [Thermodesulfobacteriota bacterium]
MNNLKLQNLFTPTLALPRQRGREYRVSGLRSACGRMGTNYLVATEKPVGLVINFGEQKVEIKRKVRDFDEDLQDEF